jgi:DNA repair protein RadC
MDFKSELVGRDRRGGSGEGRGVAIVNARDAAELLAPLFAERAGETLAILYLDAAREPIAREMRDAPGDAIALPLREIFAAALGHRAAGLIVAHNHPSGDATPSRADIEATRLLAETGANLGIRLHDHLIFAGAECRSFRELGLL